MNTNELASPLRAHTVPEPPSTPPQPPTAPPSLPEIDDPPSPHPADPVTEPGAPPPPVGQVARMPIRGRLRLPKIPDWHPGYTSATPASASSDFGCLRLSQRYSPLPSTTIVMRSSSAQTIFSGKPP